MAAGPRSRLTPAPSPWRRNQSPGTQGIWTNLSRGDARRGPCPDLAAPPRRAWDPTVSPERGLRGSGPGAVRPQPGCGAEEGGCRLPSSGPARAASPSCGHWAPRRPTQQVPANAYRCPAPPPCPSAAAVVERRARQTNAGPEDAGGRGLGTPRPSHTHQPAEMCASPQRLQSRAPGCRAPPRPHSISGCRASPAPGRSPPRPALPSA